MSERFDGGDWRCPNSSHERTPEQEVREHFYTIQRLLGRLINSSGELSQDTKNHLQDRIQGHLAALGLSHTSQLSGIAWQLNDVIVDAPTPPEYPTERDFFNQLHGVTQPNPNISSDLVTRAPTFLDIASHARVDARTVDRRGIELPKYLYGLGKVMSNPLAYEASFLPSDTIHIGHNTHVINGRHRALTMRVLGPDYVQKSGMQQWIKIGHSR